MGWRNVYCILGMLFAVSSAIVHLDAAEKSAELSDALAMNFHSVEIFPIELISNLGWKDRSTGIPFDQWVEVAQAGWGGVNPLGAVDSPRLPACFACLGKNLANAETASISRSPRLVLFRMTPGFLATPLGLESEDDAIAEETDLGTRSAAEEDGNFLQVSVGKHIPYLDMFRRKDPGGLGYYRIHSQIQILDCGSSSLCVGLQAYTPVGQSNAEVINGPTTLIPALSCFQEIYEGTAVHGFIGQPVHANSHWRDNLFSGFHYGVAIQQPISVTPNCPNQGFFVFVQTMGQYRTDGLRSDGKAPAPLEVIPGLQWRMNSACWMSLGVSRYNFLSCSWQY